MPNQRYRISKFHLSPNKLMEELADMMREYNRNSDNEFLYDRIKFSNYQTELDDYKSNDDFTNNMLLYQLQEDVNILIQQYLRFGRRIVEEVGEDNNEIISFPKGTIPRGYVDGNHNTVKDNFYNKGVHQYER